jgi:hypothetical protein
MKSQLGRRASTSDASHIFQIHNFKSLKDSIGTRELCFFAIKTPERSTAFLFFIMHLTMIMRRAAAFSANRGLTSKMTISKRVFAAAAGGAKSTTTSQANTSGNAARWRHSNASEKHRLSSYSLYSDYVRRNFSEELNFQELESIAVRQANALYHRKLCIRETVFGWGVFADCDYKAGDLVVTGFLPEHHALSTEPSKYTVQTDIDKHWWMDLPASFINHSCHPNLGLKPPSNNTTSAVYDFYAKRNIKAGEQLFWDYETTEYEISEKFNCQCGAPNCRKSLKGFRHHSRQVLAEHGENGEWVAPYLLRMINKKQQGNTKWNNVYCSIIHKQDLPTLHHDAN